jgi:hypothetical protein
MNDISLILRIKTLCSSFKKYLFVKTVEKNYSFLSATLIPLLVRFSNFLSVNRRRKNKTVSNEAARLVAWADKNRNSSCYLIYDFSNSPYTYGDFFNSIILARFLETLNLSVNIYLLGSTLPPIVQGDLSQDRGSVFLKELQEMSTTLTNATSVKLLVGIDSERTLVDARKNQSFIIFENLVASNKPIYTHLFDLINTLLDGASEPQRMSTLLSSVDFKSVEINEPAKPFISIPCRFNQNWAQQRNLSKNEFLQVIEDLQQAWPSSMIMIVSDEAGCDHYRSIAEAADNSCYYSQDYAKNFLESGALILKSEAWVQIKGGGIGIFVIWSKIAHLTYLVPAHEYSISEGYLRQNSKFQKFKIIYGGPSRKRLRRDIANFQQEIRQN